MFHPAFWLVLAGVLVSAFIAFALFCYIKHKSLSDGASTLGSALRNGIHTLDVSALAKIHALENGGHLASGTAQDIFEARVAAGPNNGSQPHAAQAAATA